MILTPKDCKQNKKFKIEEYKEKYKEYLLNQNNMADPVPTCSSNLNTILNGGLQPGKIVELYGHEGSGKSSLALSICASMLKKSEDKFACIIDAEGGICSIDNLRNIGISPEKSMIINVSEGDKVFNIAEDVTKEKKCIMVIVDSIASLLTEEDISVGGSSLGSHARLISKRTRKLIGVLNESKSQTIVIFINQIRNKINDLWKGETNYTTTGGKALKYYSSLRIEMSRSDYIKDREMRMGFYAKIKIIKSRVSVPYLECYIPFIYGNGFSEEIEIIDTLIDKQIIERSGGGAWHYIEIKDEKFSFRTKWTLIQKCLEDKVFFKELKTLSTSTTLTSTTQNK